MRNALTLAGSRLATLPSGRLGSLLTSALFAALLWLATAAGRIAIPGTPVPITLQTFVVMLAALMPARSACRCSRAAARPCR